MPRFLILLLFAALAPAAALAQPARFVAAHAAGEILDIDKPRIALAADGASAIAFDALFRDEFTQEWQVAVQLFSAAGAEVGPLHLFAPESGCATFDFWTSDYQHDVEIAFRSDGILIVLMRHEGFLEVGGDGVRHAQLTIGAVGPDGQAIDLNPSVDHCRLKKLIFVGGNRQDRGRLAILPTNEMLITADGFFQDSDSRNVAIRALGSELEELIEEVIPHDDPTSRQSFHMRPDIAASGSLMLSVWQECPIVDQQGNADDCDVYAQFAAITEQGLQAVGENWRVNAGDAPGTVQFHPSVAMNASGASVVVWWDARTGPFGDIFAQRFDAQANPVGPNIQVSISEGDINRRAEVALLDDDSFTVAWTDSTAGVYRARGREFDASGTPLGPPFFFADPSAGIAGLPHVASDGTRVGAVWASEVDGSIGIHSNTIGYVAAEDAPGAPLSATPELSAFPNPFASRSTLRYRLPAPADVRLTVHDLLGREVARLADGPAGPGLHDIPVDAANLPAGVYLVRLRVGPSEHTTLVVKVE